MSANEYKACEAIETYKIVVLDDELHADPAKNGTSNWERPVRSDACVALQEGRKVSEANERREVGSGVRTPFRSF